MGKGDKQRPFDWQKFNDNYDRIFKKREVNKNGKSKRNDQADKSTER